MLIKLFSGTIKLVYKIVEKTVMLCVHTIILLTIALEKGHLIEGVTGKHLFNFYFDLQGNLFCLEHDVCSWGNINVV